MENEKISVVIPTYNAEKYIHNAIKSILNQTYKNLQIILVDDGSTDNSGKICDEFAEKDSRIEVIHKKNGGAADARNYGLEKVNGEYIAFLDSDDYLYPTFYEELYKLLKQHNTDIAECDYVRINIDDYEKSQQIIENENLKFQQEEEINNNLESLRLMYGAALKPYVKKVVLWNKLYKKDLWKDIRFPAGKLYEDERTIYKVYYKANKLVSTNKILHGYIQSNNSMMRRNMTRRMIEDTLETCVEPAEFFKEHNEIEMESKARRRYLEYCIELTYKLKNSVNDEMDILLLELKNNYINYYKNFIDLIKVEKSNEDEKEIIQLLDLVYSKLLGNEDISKYWKELQKITTKK